MGQKKLCFVGNCQTQFLGRIIKFHDFPIDHIELPLAHLATGAEKESFLSAYEEADVIVTRLISKGVEEFLLTDYLRTRYAEKLVVIPNLYFNGFDPDSCRIYSLEGKAIRGPLGDYSCNMIHYSYVNSWTMERCLSLIKSNEILKWYPSSVHKSINEQKAREAYCNIKMSDYIDSNMLKERLFYTFNHPKGAALIELFSRLMNHLQIGGSQQWVYDQEFLALNSLSEITTPIHPAIQKFYDIKFRAPEFQFKSIYDEYGHRLPLGKSPHYYSVEELIPMFYARYAESGVRRIG